MRSICQKCFYSLHRDRIVLVALCDLIFSGDIAKSVDYKTAGEAAGEIKKIDLICDRIEVDKNDCEIAYEIMIIRGDHVEEFRFELFKNDGDLPTLGLYDESLCSYVVRGSKYRGGITVSRTKGGNTRIRQFLGNYC